MPPPPPQPHHLNSPPPLWQLLPPGPSPPHHRGGPSQQPRPPGPPPPHHNDPSRKGLHGAVRVQDHRRYLLLDYETLACKVLGRYSVIIAGHLSQQYHFRESNADVEFKAHSLLAHCHGWGKEMSVRRISVDTEEWKFMKEIENKAKELTMQQLRDLKKDASERLGSKRSKHMAQIEKCKQFLSLGKSVTLREWPIGKDPITYAHGTLHGIVGKSMWIGGRKCDIGPYDLATDHWTLDEDEDSDLMIEEGSPSSSPSTPTTSIVEAATVGSEGKNSLVAPLLKENGPGKQIIRELVKALGQLDCEG